MLTYADVCGNKCISLSRHLQAERYQMLLLLLPLKYLIYY